MTCLGCDGIISVLKFGSNLTGERILKIRCASAIYFSYPATFELTLVVTAASYVTLTGAIHVISQLKLVMQDGCDVESGK